MINTLQTVISDHRVIIDDTVLNMSHDHLAPLLRMHLDLIDGIVSRIVEGLF